MQTAIHYWGPDGSSTWCQGSIGLGHLMLHNTAESLHESLPICCATTGTVLTASARLDNRSDLFNALKVPPSEQALLSDSELILKAYLKWGTKCPDQLLGDWTFVLWDAQKHQLFLARDQYGVSGLYYYQHNQTLLFASSIKAILAFPDSKPQLNPSALERGSFPKDATTLYQGILRLLPAQAITINTEKTRAWFYWCLENIPDVRYQSDQEYQESFLNIYTEAVRCRLRSNRPIGLMLSGGLDSGSIAVLAARELESRGQRLQAFSAIPSFDISNTIPEHLCGDETPFIEATCRRTNNIDQTYLKAETITPLSAIERALDLHGLPHANTNYNWMLELLAVAQRQNVGVLLDGWRGNLTVSWTGNRPKHLKQLLKNREWSNYINEIKNWHQLNQNPLWRTIAGQVIKPFIPPVWERRYNKLRNRKFKIKKISLIDAIRESYSATEVDSQALNANIPGLYFYRFGHTALYYELASGFGLEVRQPTMDKRLIEFCAGIPQDQYIQKGQHKRLIRESMAELLPKEVLLSKNKGKQSADIDHHILNNQSEIEEAIKNIRSSRLATQHLDIEKIEDAFVKLQHHRDPNTVFSTSNTLLKGLSTGLFLYRLENG